MSDYATRDAIAFARASIEGDHELMDEILKRYLLRGDELVLVCTLAALVGFARDGAEDMADELFELQLAGAAR
jgi:hypothetical protein